MSDDNSLDWTISDAPSDDEPPDPPAAGPLKPPRLPKPRPSSPIWLSRRTGLLLAAVAALALLITAALPRWEAWRTRQAVAAVVAQQEQARLAGDWTVLRQYYSALPTDFATNQIVPLSNGLFPAPIDLPGLQPRTQAGRVGQFLVLGSGLVRADVVRSISLADGTEASFAMPQFYQFAAGVWRQVPPPDTDPEPALQLHGARVDVTYYPADADLARMLAHDLDALVVQACADWDCPADVRVPVRFDANNYAWVDHPPPFDTQLGSLTFQTLYLHQGVYVWREIRLHSRLVGGYPADGAADEAVRRAAGVQALLGVAQLMTARRPLPGGSAFIEALVVREGARLGSEPPDLSQLQIADPLFTPNDLWQVGSTDMSGAEAAQHEALALLNQLLAGRALADEARLLHLLDSGAADTQSWLAAGLGLTAAEAETRLNAALDPRFPAAQPLNFAPDLALSCPTGPMLAALAGQTAPLLAGEFPDSFVESWSPDGQQLALTISGRLGVFNLANATGQFVPQPIGPWSYFVAWASPTVLVYPPAHATIQLDPGTQLSQISIDALGLTFFDSSNRQSTHMADFQSYRPSPDYTHAAISNSRFPTTMLEIIPALDASSQLFIQGGDAVWSPDSQQLVYSHWDEPNVSLHRLDLATNTDYTLTLTADPGEPSLPVGTAIYYVNSDPAWSSTGDWIALTVMTSLGDQYETWAGVIRPDGTGLHILFSASVNAAPSGALFSADSRYLAVQLQGDKSAQGIAIYSVPDWTLLRFIPGLHLASWSPTGHMLALTGPAGVSLLDAPDDANAAPQPIGAPGCSGAAWRPK